MLMGQMYHGAGIDVWSSGVVLFAMACGHLPFEHNNNRELQRLICMAKYQVPVHVSKDLDSLMRLVFCPDPEQRITFEGILEHAWTRSNFKGNSAISQGIDNFTEVPLLNDKIIDLMLDKKYKREDLEFNLMNNKHNQFTTYY